MNNYTSISAATPRIVFVLCVLILLPLPISAAQADTDIVFNGRNQSSAPLLKIKLGEDIAFTTYNYKETQTTPCPFHTNAGQPSTFLAGSDGQKATTHVVAQSYQCGIARAKAGVRFMVEPADDGATTMPTTIKLKFSFRQRVDFQVFTGGSTSSWIYLTLPEGQSSGDNTNIESISFVHNSGFAERSETLTEIRRVTLVAGQTYTALVNVDAHADIYNGDYGDALAEASIQEIKVIFNKGAYLLKVGKRGNGGGVVTSNPSGINCGSDCSHSYRSGAKVKLTAKANSGSVFAGWSGACSGATSRCQVTMSQARTVTAAFTKKGYYLLTVNKTGNGKGAVTSNPSGINCGSDCSHSYRNGAKVKLTAKANSGSVFTGWSGACSGTGSCRVTMTRARAVTASFGAPPGKATLLGPSGLITDDTPTYRWRAVTAAARYYLRVIDAQGDNLIQQWYTAAQAHCADGKGACTVTPAMALAKKSYKWWIRTWNSAGYGPWSGALTFTLQLSPAVYENTTRSGSVYSDEIWKGVIDITGDVTIYSPATVTIEPGTIIRFTARSDDQMGGGTTPITDPYFPHDPFIAPSQMSSIAVFGGTLYAVGTPDHPITFTSSAQNRQPGDWHSLQYNKAGSKLILRYATIEYGYYGVQINDPATDSNVTFKNNIVRNIVACGVCTGYSGIDPARSVTITVSSNDFSACGHEGVDTHANAIILIEDNIFHDIRNDIDGPSGAGVVIDNNNSIIRNNQFLRNRFGINVISPNSYPVISGNTFVDNWVDCFGFCP